VGDDRALLPLNDVMSQVAAPVDDLRNGVWQAMAALTLLVLSLFMSVLQGFLANTTLQKLSSWLSQVALGTVVLFTGPLRLGIVLVVLSGVGPLLSVLGFSSAQRAGVVSLGLSVLMSILVLLLLLVGIT